MGEDQKLAFTTDEIEDVRIIIKAKGKHWAITPKKSECTAEEARQIRIGLLAIVCEFHYVVDVSLEDMPSKKLSEPPITIEAQPTK
jgi:uncharacterized lipoprotein YbaY